MSAHQYVLGLLLVTGLSACSGGSEESLSAADPRADTLCTQPGCQTEQAEEDSVTPFGRRLTYFTATHKGVVTDFGEAIWDTSAQRIFDLEKEIMTMRTYHLADTVIETDIPFPYLLDDWREELQKFKVLEQGKTDSLPVIAGTTIKLL